MENSKGVRSYEEEVDCRMTERRAIRVAAKAHAQIDRDLNGVTMGLIKSLRGDVSWGLTIEICNESGGLGPNKKNFCFFFMISIFLSFELGKRGKVDNPNIN